MKFFILFLIITFTSCYKKVELLEISGELRMISVLHEKSAVTTNRIFYYNSAGLVAKQEWEYISGESLGEIVYFYNDDNLLLKEESKLHYDLYTIDFLYNEQGLLITQNSNKAHKFDYEYDEKLRLIKKKQFNLDDGKKHYYFLNVFEYDSINHDKIIVEKTYTSGYENDEGLYEHLVYEYDVNDNLIQKELVDGVGALNRGTKEFYVYDNEGRISKRIDYDLHVYFPGGLITHTYFYY